MIRCVTRHHPSENRISLLSDEILISILSLLPFKEAARTSVLSKRWIHVWAYVPLLDFNATSTLFKITESTSGGRTENFSILLERERGCFVRWVNKVLQSHKALTMDEFRVYCDLGESYKAEIDKWLQYAFSKNVRSLELNLSNYNMRSGFYDICPFSDDVLGLRSLQSSKINSCVHFQSLKILILKRVNVSEEHLNFFLHNCKFLERLVVHRSRNLEKLEVSGPDLALQHLELYFCPFLKSLIVRNINLISLKVSYPGELVLKDVPKLVDFCLSGYIYILEDVIRQLSCCLSKLEVLTFLFQVKQYKEKIAEFLPQLTGLKQLTLTVDGSYDKETMLGLTDFVRASPNLEKFVLKMYGLQSFRCGRKLKSAVKDPHHHLKVVELHGCYGSTNELELVKYFLENAVSLEKIILNPRFQLSFEYPWFLQRPVTEQEEDLSRYLKVKLEDLFPWEMTKVRIDICK